uniref:Uncharacterized protein n=1 Tax=Anguilla anguilla TaxID=7936 RepID=A0A0E9TJZ1_ANGAN
MLGSFSSNIFGDTFQTESSICFKPGVIFFKVHKESFLFQIQDSVFQR